LEPIDKKLSIDIFQELMQFDPYLPLKQENIFLKFKTYQYLRDGI